MVAAVKNVRNKAESSNLDQEDCWANSNISEA